MHEEGGKSTPNECSLRPFSNSVPPPLKMFPETRISEPARGSRATFSCASWTSNFPFLSERLPAKNTFSLEKENPGLPVSAFEVYKICQ